MSTKKKTSKLYRLRVGDDGPIGQFAPLGEIHHVAHLATATSILRKGRIPARRVADQSCLDGRTSVCWLAPNQWAHKGSRYGTVQFTFDFEELVQGKEIYWVEGVPGRKLATCRLLIAEKDGRHLGLKRYDPDSTEGPLRRIGGRWYWKNDIEFEVMLECRLPLTACRRISAVPHNGDRCRGTCGEVGQPVHETAARLLAGLMRGRYALPEASYVHAGRASQLLHDGWFGLVDALDLIGADAPGTVMGADRVDAVVRTALTRLRKGDTAGAVEAIATVAGSKRVRRSLRRLLQRHTGLELGRPYDTVIGLAGPAAPATNQPRERQRCGGGRGPGRKDADGRRDRAADFRAVS